MDWLQITIEATAEHAEQVGDLLTAAGATAVTIRSGDAPALYEPGPGEAPLWDRLLITGLFDGPERAAAITTRLRAAAAPDMIVDLHVATLADRQWERSCLDDLRPQRFGARTWVTPSWCEAPAAPEAVVITLDPGLAFGTGGHATTALCLEWLDAHPWGGGRVIDYGCGSGLLGIAAARHGAAEVWCVDHDPQALTATRANAQQNGVAPVVRVCLPDEMPSLQFDVMLANILAAPLIELAPRFAALVRRGGALVLSGLLVDQGRELIAAYAPWFDLAEGARRDGWLMLTGERSAAPA